MRRKTDRYPAFEDYPASKEKGLPWLRRQKRQPLPQQFLEVLGGAGPTLLKQMGAAYRDNRQHPPTSNFDSWARRVLRGCARIEDPKGRRQYVDSCIANLNRVAELEDWLNENPDPYETLDEDDLRAMPREAFRNYFKQRTENERELCALQNGPSGLTALSKRVGPELAWKMLSVLMSVINASTKRGSRQINSVMAHAASPKVRNPERDVRACCRKELSKRSGATKSHHEEIAGLAK
jgi:hypothetical protein